MEVESLFTSILMLLLYFLPTIVANKRKHSNCTPILLLNLFLGWTLVFWVIALVWATSDNVKHKNGD